MRWLVLLLAACGGRLADDDASMIDGGNNDVITAYDVRPHVDAPIEDAPPPGPCTIGPNLGLPLGQCSASQDIWFASPYTPPTDITVMRIEAYMRQGDVALLASSAGAPGALLFQGSVGMSAMPAWIGTSVSPPVTLKGGTLYYLGFRNDCSFTVGGSEPVEYISKSINGPWMVSGTDNWTARLIGTCK
jgi:hypothetical protein